MRLSRLAIVFLSSSVAATAGSAAGCADGTSQAATRAAPTSAALRPSVDRADLLAIRSMLMAENFRALERRLRWNVDSARRDPDYEGRYRAAFDVFDVGDPALDPHLDAWVERSPKSSVAHLARATYRITKASLSYAESSATPGAPALADAMFHWGDLAKQDIEVAYRRDPMNVLIYFHSIGIAMWYGERERQRVLFSQGLTALPGSLLLRIRYMHALSPRWGGSLEQMTQLADQADRAASSNRSLRMLRGFLPYESASALYRDGDYLGAIRLYTEAMRFGDLWQFRLDRGNAYYEAKEYEPAITDLSAALANRPAMVGALAHRAASYDFLAPDSTADARRDSLVQLGRADIDFATTIDSTDAELTKVLQAHPALRTPRVP